MTQCDMREYAIAPTSSPVVPLQEGVLPCLKPQGGLLRDQEGFCALYDSLERTPPPCLIL